MSERNAELAQLAQVLADWLAPAEGFTGYLFGSRARGDHRPDSDVDIRFFLEECSSDDRGAEWWMEQNETDFSAVKAKLPGRLEIHRERQDDADPHIRSAVRNPTMTIGRLVVVWTSPKEPK